MAPYEAEDLGSVTLAAVWAATDEVAPTRRAQPSTGPRPQTHAPGTPRTQEGVTSPMARYAGRHRNAPAPSTAPATAPRPNAATRSARSLPAEHETTPGRPATPD